jgi:hypothetical protein
MVAAKGVENVGKLRFKERRGKPQRQRERVGDKNSQHHAITYS